MFVNLFAGGRSEVKIYLFFIYVLLLSTIYVWYHKYKKSLHTYPYTSILKTLGISLSFLFIIGVVTHIYLIKSLGLQISAFLITFKNEEISSSVLQHIHTVKGSMALILSFFQKKVFESVDTGLAFLGIFPTPIFIFSIICLCITLGGFIYLYTHVLKHKEETKTYIYLITYAILSFSILKNTVDGGLFNSETIPSIFFLYIVLIGYTNKLGLRLYICVTLCLSFLILCVNIYLYNNYIIDFVGVLSLYILLTYFSIFYTKNIYITLYIVVLSIFGIYIGIEKDRLLFMYAHTTIPPQSKVYIQTKKDIDLGLISTKEYLGDMIFYTSTTTATTSIKNIIENTGAPLNFMNVSLGDKTCNILSNISKSYYLFTKKTLTPEQEYLIKNYRSSFITVKDLYRIPNLKDSMYPTYIFTATQNSCTGRWVEVLQELFNHYGVNEFFISGYNLN